MFLYDEKYRKTAKFTGLEVFPQRSYSGTLIIPIVKCGHNCVQRQRPRRTAARIHTHRIKLQFMHLNMVMRYKYYFESHLPVQSRGNETKQ